MKRPRHNLIVLALAIGLAYGLVEALEVMLLYAVPGGLSWLTGNTPYVVWVAPLVYAAAFVLIAVLLAALAPLAARVDWESVLVALLLAAAGFFAASLQGSIASDVTSAILGAGIAAEGTRQFRKHRVRMLTLARRSIGWLGALVLVMALATVGGSRVVERVRLASLNNLPSPAVNVLLLVMDTQRADHLSLYGYGRNTSPRLDSIAARSVVFDNASANSSWTLPTHATMFTGKLPFEHRAGIMGRSRLDSRYATIAEALSARGYATGGFVANTFWAGRHTGLNRGFQRYRDHYGSAADAITRTALGRRFAYDVMPLFGFVDVPGRKRASDVNREMLSWLDAIGDRPYFAFLNYFDVHSPLLPPRPFAGAYSGMSPAEQKSHAIAVKDLDGAQAPPQPAELQKMVDAYDESIRYLDYEIGNLLDSLERRGKLGNTLLIITSDHGESWGEHGLMFHGQSLYREVTHVPLIVHLPGNQQSAHRRGAVGLDQIPATIAAFTGVPRNRFPGLSLFADSSSQHGVLIQLPRRNTRSAAQPASRSSLAGLVTGRWQYVQSSSGSEIFDLAADPRGLVDVSRQPQVRDTVEMLRARLGERQPNVNLQ